MPNFDSYVAKLGEFGVLALIEKLERYEGIKASIECPLEERWARVMCDTQLVAA